MSPADRDLLFGLCALQLDLLARNQLVAAAQACLSRDNASLKQVLLERNLLSDQDVAAVERLVEQHVAATVTSEATLSLEDVVPADPEVIRQLETLASEDLLKTLSRVSAAGQAGPGGDQRHWGKNGAAGAVRFQDVVFHAKGGLGEVWKALDEELGREVALKRIKTEYSHDEEFRQSFAWEAEVTGNLEHPGIVPVYGFGRYEDGRPFYAMRFIRGASLKEEIEKFHSPAAPSGANSLRPQNPRFRRLLKSLIDPATILKHHLRPTQ